MKDFWKDFRGFITKGNVLDLAIAIIIGTAFNQIVKSLVNDIVMPLVSLLFKADMSNLYILLRGEANYIAGELILSEDAVLLTYGNFITQIVNFLIIALSIFVAIKFVQKMHTRIDEYKGNLNPEKENNKETGK
ncbi:MAG: large conductance mechanosensitive channel protein MscL [Candidatus Izimaplasma sp.]|nr:large conductance mechanosensitive channel protein MscL [Candidatus Izimaplasma bacterium]